MLVMRTRGLSFRTTAWLLAGALTFGSAHLAAAQASPRPATSPETGSPVSQADLARIRKALQTAPTLNLGENQLRYYVRILGQRQDFLEFMKGYDFKNGPTRRGNPMTHQEFLAMVTPKEMNSSGGITAMETLQFAFTNWLGQSLVKKAIEDLRNAKSEREVQEIRDRIDRELAALRPPGGSN
jgi:hypothetical protein